MFSMDMLYICLQYIIIIINNNFLLILNTDEKFLTSWDFSQYLKILQLLQMRFLCYQTKNSIKIISIALIYLERNTNTMQL